MKAEMNEKMNELACEIIDKLQEYYDEYRRVNTYGRAVIWLRNDETGQTVCFTRGEYSDELIKFVEDKYMS